MRGVSCDCCAIKRRPPLSAINYCTVEIVDLTRHSSVIDPKSRKSRFVPQLGGPRRNTAIRFGIRKLHCVHKKNKAREFLPYFYLGLMKFYKICTAYFWVYSGHKCSCISNKAYVIPLPETFYFNDVVHSWNRLLVEWTKLDHSAVVAAISQWRRRLFACVRAHSGYFEHILWCFHASLC